MSDGPIKPNDIPKALSCEVMSRLLRIRDFQDVEPTPSIQSQIAMILNQAIESGVVSPPCHYYERDGRRDRSFELLKLWPGKPSEKYCKHWKGEE